VRLVFRWHRSAAVYWTAAIALALVTAMFVAGVVRDAELRAARYGVVRRVPVARRSIAVGARLGPADVVMRVLPVALLPTGPVARALTGRTVVVPLTTGEVVLASKLAPTGLRGVAALLRDDERALAVPAGPGTPPLAVGDRVDVLATPSEGGETIVVAADARVVGVDDRAVTVAVYPEVATGLAAALAGATVTLALAAA
jgi:Flp pilus assembly protein CpaB